MKKKGMYINICTHIHTYNISFYIHRIKQYSAIEKKEILPFETTWMDFNGIMLSEISQGEKGTLCYHLFVKCERKEGGR